MSNTVSHALFAGFKENRVVKKKKKKFLQHFQFLLKVEPSSLFFFLQRPQEKLESKLSIF